MSQWFTLWVLILMNLLNMDSHAERPMDPRALSTLPVSKGAEASSSCPVLRLSKYSK